MTNNNIDNLLKEFESKSKKDENNIEFWYARDLQKLLQYDKWDNFKNVINKAIDACENAKVSVEMNFLEVFPDIGKNTDIVGGRPGQDYKLTRYACYLVAQNGNPKKEAVAFAQTYFAIQARRKELDDINFIDLSEEDRRIRIRNDIKEHNKLLASEAKKSGVITPLDYAIFQNFGYKGLYGGLDKKSIQKKKGLEKKEILDYMGSEELAANFFRVTQTEAKLKKDKIKVKKEANNTHFEVGKKIRDSMVNKPEELAISKESTKQLEKRKK